MLQNISAVAWSLIKIPLSTPNSGLSFSALPLVTILNTVAITVAIVHSDIATPACAQLGLDGFADARLEGARGPERKCGPEEVGEQGHRLPSTEVVHAGE